MCNDIMAHSRLFFSDRVLAKQTTARTVTPVNQVSQTKDIAVCAPLVGSLHIVFKVRIK